MQLYLPSETKKLHPVEEGKYVEMCAGCSFSGRILQPVGAGSAVLPKQSQYGSGLRGDAAVAVVQQLHQSVRDVVGVQLRPHRP